MQTIAGLHIQVAPKSKPLSRTIVSYRIKNRQWGFYMNFDYKKATIKDAIRVKSMYMKKTWLKTRKTENIKIKVFSLRSPSKRLFRNLILFFDNLVVLTFRVTLYKYSKASVYHKHCVQKGCFYTGAVYNNINNTLISMKVTKNKNTRTIRLWEKL